MFKNCASLFVLLALATAAQAVPFTNYTGLDGGGWTVDYQYHIQNGQSLSNGSPFYDTDNSAAINASTAGGGLHISRVAYVMEVQSGTGPDQYVFASFDPQSTNAAKLGVPTAPSLEVYQENVANLHVLSGGGAPVTNGVFAGGGNIEFWPSDYGTNNANGVPGASNGSYDTGDQNNGGTGYGSMQIHNHDASLVGGNQVLIAFNQWNGGGGELGIGNQPGGQPDWTFSSNAGAYNIKDIQVLVQVVPEPSSVILCGLGLVGLVIAARRRKA